MLASSDDGTGGDYFYHLLADEENLQTVMDNILSKGRNETVPDQWEAQILTRILLHATVIYVSEMDDEIVKNMHMIPAHSLDEALDMARKIVGKDKAKITAIPDGISVMVVK